jgi:hypothetical protein
MLSKSLFIRGLQCIKSLYLHKKRPYLRDKLSSETLAKFKRGHKVGVLARDLFPGGILLYGGGGKLSEKTKLLVYDHIRLQTPVLYEVPFEYDDLIAIMDIVTYQEGKWNAYEVKSSAAISDTFLWDITFQAYIIKHSGLENIDFHIIHLNEPWNDPPEPNLPGLFNIVNVNREIEEKAPFIEQLIQEMRAVEQMEQSPDISLQLTNVILLWVKSYSL